jgi:sugar O-acyltransferase (sialic acid O-acetyltransferase NeuD family)
MSNKYETNYNTLDGQNYTRTKSGLLLPNTNYDEGYKLSGNIFVPESLPENEMYLLGGGGHSKVVRGVLKSNNIDVIGVFDDNPDGARNKKKLLDGRKLVNGEIEIDKKVISCIGNNYWRTLKAMQLEHLNLKWGNAIHNTAIISETSYVDVDTVVLQGAIIQQGAKIGKHVLINTASSVDHDSIVGDGSHISPGARLCGHVEIGKGVHIGAGAVVIPEIKIEDWVTVGALGAVSKDIPAWALVKGSRNEISRFGYINKNDKGVKIGDNQGAKGKVRDRRETKIHNK